MGIFKFRSWLDARKFKGTNIFQEAVPGNVGTVFLDMNGILHKIAQKVYGYGNGDPKSFELNRKGNEKKKAKQIERLKRYAKFTAQELDMKLKYKIFKKVVKIAKFFGVKDYVVMAVDGVAPMAKITQQRKRRYKGMKESRESALAKSDSSESEDNHPHEDFRSNIKFNGNCITPGTEFMFELDAYMQYAIQQTVLKGKLDFKNIVYSSQLVPGEGEHKIFDVVRNKNIEIDPDKTHVIYGADADLTMLSMLSDIPNLYHCREKYTENISVDNLKYYLRSKLRKRTTNIASKIIYQDFVLMIYLLGNDFLPKIMSFNFKDTNKNVERIFGIYAEMSLPLTDDNGQIVWYNFHKFMVEMAKLEPELLDGINKMIDAQQVSHIPALAKATQRVKVDNISGAQFENVVNMEVLEKEWYEKTLLPLEHEGLKNLGLEITVTKKDIKDMCIEYFKGLQWCLRYYLKGHKTVSSRFIYIYHYAPLLTTMEQVLRNVTESELPTISDVKNNIDDPVITPIHQLMCVMPEPDWNFIPGVFRNLMGTKFPDISPYDWFTDYEGIDTTRDAFTAAPLISIVDPVRITRETEEYPIPIKYAFVRTKYVPVVYNPVINIKKYGLISELNKTFNSGPDKKAYDDYKGNRDYDNPTEIVSASDTYLEEIREEAKHIPPEPIIEPKSGAQMHRIIEARVKKLVVKHQVPKGEIFAWTDGLLM